MEIEKIATGAVKSMIARTERLSNFINDGDKEPVWDGNVYIHEDAKRTKKNIKRVSVQIKGKLVLGTGPKKIKYRVVQDDLNGYLHNGGAIFFVVYIDKNTGIAKQVYYSLMLPLKIMKLQKENDPEKPILVAFSQYPDDPTEQTELFLNFYADSQRQASFVDVEPPTVEELVEKGILESISFNYTKVGEPLDELSLPKVVEGKPISLYANLKGFSVPVPVRYIDEICHVTAMMEQNLPVCVDNVCYYDQVKMVSTAEHISIKIGKVLTIVQPHDLDGNEPITFNFKITGTLSERVAAIRFLKAVREKGSFMLAGKSVPMIFTDEQLTTLHADEWDSFLEDLTLIDRILKDLHVTKDLDMNQLDHRGKSQLDMLLHSVGKGETLTDVHGEYPGAALFSLGNVKLLLFAKRNEDDSCSLCDYFGVKFTVTVDDQNGISYPISQHALLKKNHFLHVDNMDLNMVVEDLLCSPTTEVSTSQVNNTMLEMLLAYDEEPREEFLSGCIRIAEWLCSLEKVFPQDIALINKLQITARVRELTFSEKQQLYKLIERSDNDTVKIGALLLLGEEQEALKKLKALPKEEQKLLLKYPIFRFCPGVRQELVSF